MINSENVAEEYVKKCRSCQEHDSIQHQTIAMLTPIESSSQDREMDIVGPFPPIVGQVWYLFVVMNISPNW